MGTKCQSQTSHNFIGPWTSQTKSDFEYCLLCFGHTKAPWQIRLNQTSSTAYSALEKHKGPLASKTKSDFEYCLLCFWKAQMSLANQTKSDLEYSLPCFGKHKGPWTTHAALSNLIKTRILGFVDGLIRHQSSRWKQRKRKGRKDKQAEDSEELL